MFGYRHLFHAGNFADVTKHVILVALLESLQRKETPFAILDTHGGIGRYRLDAAEAQKKREFDSGIGLLWRRVDVPEPVARYLALVRRYNADSELNHYPGSPRIARDYLRAQDRLIVTELNPHDHAILREEFAGDGQVSVHLQDAYQGLKAFLPPREKRGLVLIDPAFELRDEYERLVQGVTSAWKRWPTGIYAIWYPIQSQSLVTRLHDAIRGSGIRKVLSAELTIRPADQRSGLNGSGMLIINPPWQLEAVLETALAYLQKVLEENGKGSHRVEWLVGE
jgi:23S rRNA (adenine2030-N6)-methyltransferase